MGEPQYGPKGWPIIFEALKYKQKQTSDELMHYARSILSWGAWDKHFRLDNAF